MKRDIEKVEHDTAESMALLVELDEIKSRMQATTDALAEADNWTTLAENVDAAFAADDLKNVATSLLGMKRSLIVLSDTPDFAERSELLQLRQRQFEAKVTPELEAAFVGHELERAKECVAMMRDIDREGEVLGVYSRCHEKQLLGQWRDLCGNVALSLDAVLTQYHDKLAALGAQEQSWCNDLFGNDEMLCALLAQLLTGRKPSLQQRITEDLASGTDQLARLIQLHALSKQFLDALPQCNAAVRDAAMAPFVSFQLDYGTLQSRELARRPSFAEPSDDASLSDMVQAVRASVPAVFADLESASDRCFELTSGLGLAGLMKCADSHVAAYVNRLLAVLPAIRGQTEREAAAAFKANQDMEEWGHTNSVFGLLEVSGMVYKSVAKFQSGLVPKAQAASAARGADAKMGHLEGNASAQVAYSVCLDNLRKGADTLVSSVQRLKTFNDAVHSFASDTVLSPLRRKLAAVQKTDWQNEDEASFSLSPLGYITQVGEQLLTLPQELEAFFEADNELVAAALSRAALPFAELVEGDSVADKWLGSVAHGVMAHYVKDICKVKTISGHGCMQLCADIDYLCNVLSALDIAPATDLNHANQLLSIDDAAAYKALVAELSPAPALVKAISSMRKF